MVNHEVYYLQHYRTVEEGQLAIDNIHGIDYLGYDLRVKVWYDSSRKRLLKIIITHPENDQ